jgi:hypothetical protein
LPPAGSRGERAGAQTIYFDPSANLPSDFVFDVEIHLDTGGQPVQGLEVAVAFDPFLLNLEGISAGEWFTDAPLPFYFFDYTPQIPQGTIHFTGALLGGECSHSDRLAICHFTASTYGTSPLIFQDVDVRDNENTPLVFSPSTGDFITLDPVVPAQATSFGSIKALFR